MVNLKRYNVQNQKKHKILQSKQRDYYIEKRKKSERRKCDEDNNSKKKAEVKPQYIGFQKPITAKTCLQQR